MQNFLFLYTFDGNNNYLIIIYIITRYYYHQKDTYTEILRAFT